MLAVNASEALKDIVKFCRFVRESGFSARVTETLDSLQAVAAVAGADWATLKSVLRAELCSSKEEWDAFDPLFEEFWCGKVTAAKVECTRGSRNTHPKANSQRIEASRGSLLGIAETSTPHAAEEGSAIAGASFLERIRNTDFSEIPRTDQAALERLAERLLKQMSLRLSRRLKIAEQVGKVDLRRTIRKNIGQGGEPFDLQYKRPKMQQVQLIMLLDVSGSMNLYSLFLLRFAHALQRHFRRTETFIFSTSLREISSELRTRNLADALESLSQIPTNWSGGTKIGESLREFNRLCAKRSGSRDTFVIILSDGWDTGEPDVLSAELVALKRRARKVVWLNPLLGLHNYQPITRGMAAALPHVDVFASAHSLESLLELERHLTLGAAR